MEHGQTLGGQPLKENWFFPQPQPLPGAINWRELHYSILFMVLIALFDIFLCRRLLCGGGRGGVCRGRRGNFLCPFFQPWVCSHQWHCSSSFLALSGQCSHRSWTSTWFLVMAQTTDILMISSSNTCPGPRHFYNFMCMSVLHACVPVHCSWACLVPAEIGHNLSYSAGNQTRLPAGAASAVNHRAISSAPQEGYFCMSSLYRVKCFLMILSMTRPSFKAACDFSVVWDLI